MKKICFVGLIMSLLVEAAFCQYTNMLEQGVEQRVTNGWSVAELVVGGVTVSNRLHFLDNAVVTNGVAVVGRDVGADFNRLVLNGSNALWISTNSITVGKSGKNNALTIQSGELFGPGTEVVIGDAAAATGNALSVSGTNAFLRVDQVTVGASGSGNEFSMDGGANGIIYSGLVVGREVSGSNNVVTISGANTRMDNAGHFILGDQGANNRFELQSGAVVTNYGTVYVGLSGSASTNSATVQGDGTRWVLNSLRVGDAAETNRGNRVSVSDSGLISLTDLNIASNNHFYLNRAGTLEVRNAFDASMEGFEWSEGTLEVQGALTGLTNLTGHSKTLVLEKTGVWDGGTNDLWIGKGETSVSNRLVLTEGGRLITEGDLIVGDTQNVNQAFHTVTITNGGSLVAKDFKVQGLSNSVVLAEGGELNISGDFEIRSDNGLDWRGGGTLEVEGALTGLDAGLNDKGQILRLSGTHATWDLSGKSLAVGGASGGSDNELWVNAGAWVSNSVANIGTAGHSNRVFVTGKDARWVSTNLVNIGSTNFAGNVVTVTNRGSMVAQGIRIAGDNKLTLAKGGSLELTGAYDAAADGAINWQNDSELIFSGAVTNFDSINGSNKVLVVRNGGVLNTSSNVFTVGSWASEANQVWVTNGGSIVSGAGIIGADDGDARGHAVVIAGTGSVWTNQGALTIGGVGADHSLVITNGGTVYSASGLIGDDTSADYASVLLDGSNSFWKVAGDLTVGQAGSDNSIVIRSGAVLTNQNSVVGATGNARNNRVLVQGAGSRWLTDSLTIGAAHSFGNHVTVTNGGLVEVNNNLDVTHGRFYLQRDGQLAINTDFNVSEHKNLDWQSGGHLAVRGTLSGMASVDSTNAFNGAAYLSGGKVLTLDSKNGQWSGEQLIVGYKDQGSKLILTNGASVASHTGYLGVDGGLQNRIDIYAGSQWKSTNSFIAAGAGNRLTIHSNGFFVVGGTESNRVTGAGGILVGGTNSSAASLLVKDGAHIVAENDLWIGIDNNSNSVYTAGSVVLTNGGWLTVNDLHIQPVTSSLNIMKDGFLEVTSGFDFDEQSNVVWGSGGQLKVGKDGAGSLTNLENNTLTGTNRTLWVAGQWNATNSAVQVGGISNRLFIVEGGVVRSQLGNVGIDAADTNSIVWVMGSNSSWIVSDRLQVGNDAVTNSRHAVSVSDQGLIQAATLAIGKGDSFNLFKEGTLYLTESFDAGMEGFNWQAGGELKLGTNATLSGMNRVSLKSGSVTNHYSYLNNDRALTLSGASWSVGLDDLIIGYTNRGSRLVISDGGQVTNRNGFIGWGASSAGNEVLVTGAGSQWNNQGGSLYIGQYFDTNGVVASTGAGNALTITNGAWVRVGDIATSGVGGLAVGSSSTNRALVVVGNGSTLYAYDGIMVGSGTSSGRVEVVKGGQVTTSQLRIDTDSAFDLAGTLTMQGDFNAHMEGFGWKDDAAVAMESGALTLTNLTGASKKIHISGPASWSSETGLIHIDGSKHRITVDQEGIVQAAGFVLGAGASASDNTVTLSNTSIWDSASSSMTIGQSGSKNRFTVQSGSGVTNLNTYIGYTTNATGNAVVVKGTNSSWITTGDLYVGYAGTNSSFALSDRAQLQVGTNLYVRHGGTLTIATNALTATVGGHLEVDGYSSLLGKGTLLFSDTDNQVTFTGSPTIDLVLDGGGGTDRIFVKDGELSVAGSFTNRFVRFEQLELANSTLSGAGSVDVFESVKMNGGFIRPDKKSSLSIEGTLEVENGTTLDLFVSGNKEASRLSVKGPFDRSDLNAKVEIGRFNVLADQMHAVVMESREGGLSNRFNDVQIEEHSLYFDFDLDYSSSNVAVVATPVADGELSGSLSYAGVQGVRASYNGMLGTVATRTKQLRRNLVATAPTPRSLYHAGETNAMDGAMGPGDKNKIFGMNVWAEYFSGLGEYDAMGNNAGFELSSYGTTFGFDRMVGDDLIVGLNYTYARSSASIDNGDHADSETYWLAAYGEWFNEDEWFVDGLLGYGWSDYDFTRTDRSSYRGTGSTDGNNVGAFVNAGRYMHVDHLAFAPYAGLYYLDGDMGSYTEQGSDGVSKQVSGDRMSSFDVALGLKGRHRFDTRWGRMQTTCYAEWAYDVVNESVASSILAGDRLIRTDEVNPDPTVVNAGIGFSWTADENYEIGIGYDARLNKDFEEHRASMSINVMF
jgi:T5SS/PEP-CTERM-associated repeat protein